MASKPDRKQYYREYNEKRKEKRKEDEESKEKRKEKQELEKYRELKRQLDETIENNKDWYNPNRNPYLNRLPDGPVQKYNLEKRKRFDLQFDMDNLYSRKKGDTKTYARRREKAFNAWFKEKDLFYRIQYYRMFRREFMRRMDGLEPDKTNQLFNNCIRPTELNPESIDYRPELLHLLDEGIETDPPINVLIPREWAQQLADESSSDDDSNDWKV